MGNYYFAKRVSYMFPRPWEENLTGDARESAMWDQLLMHYESFRRGIEVTDAEMEQGINRVLNSQQQTFRRGQDAEAYAHWVKEKLGEEVQQFENQMRYLFQIDKLRDTVRPSLPVTVTEQEMQQEFLNEHHHVGGEFVLLDTKEQAEAFYLQVKAPGAWDVEKTKDPSRFRPFATITLEAIIDLWGVPKEQIYAFHAMELNSVGAPTPFGKQWVVCRLLEKRTGDLQDFPKERDAYYEQLKSRKQHEAFNRWFEELKAAAHLQVLVKPDEVSVTSKADAGTSAATPSTNSP